VLAVFRDVVAAPAFRQDKVDLAKTQLRGAIARRNEEGGAIARREFEALVYGKDTAYSRRAEYATVARITRSDLVEFHRRYFFPANVRVAIRGDFAAAEMRDRIGKVFAEWRVEQPPVAELPKVSDWKPGVYLAVKPDLAQAHFAMGQPGGEWRDKDSPALETAAAILGGGFRSRLTQRVRVQMRSTAEVSASWSAEYDFPGTFVITGNARAYSVAETIRAIRDEVERLRTVEVTDDELRIGKETALTTLGFAFDTKAKSLRRLLTYDYAGYPRDFVQQYQKSLAAVTKADIARIAKRYLDPARFVTVVVVNSADLARPLAALGMPVQEIDLTIPQPATEPVPSDAASMERGKQILARAQQAVGGVERLEAVRDFAQILEFELTPGAGGGSVTQTDRWIGPRYIRQESQFPDGRVIAFWNGTGGRISTPRGSGPLVGNQLKQVQGDLFRMYFRLLLSDRIESRAVNAVDAETVEISNAEGEIARLVIDGTTGLPARILYETVRSNAPFPISVEESIQEFQETGGMKIPSRFTIFGGGQKFADVLVVESKINQGLKVEDLQKVQ
jgi:predicted Zn-dependent peptidase